MSKRRLDKENGIQRVGIRGEEYLHIFPCIEDQGEIYHQKSAGPGVFLSYDAQLNITDEICGAGGGCDMFNEVRADNDNLRAICNEILDFLEKAPFDFRNGVEHQGMDEGEYRGGQWLCEMQDKLRSALGKPSREQELSDWMETHQLPF